MSISGQIVSEIVAQLYSENSIQTLLIFFWVDPPKFFFIFVNRLVGWAAELGPGSYPDFLSYFFPTGFFPAGFFWPPSNHCVLLVVAQLSLFSYLLLEGLRR